MSDPSVHPTREELSAYSLGQLPQERAVAIDSHISECRPCCETMVGLSDDTFVGLLKEVKHLPTDQTVDDGLAPASTADQDVPAQLAEHPRYEILGLIGKGGMGDVYKARHRKMERTVALKVINRGLVRKTEAVDRFHREVKTAAQLSHPNIVTAYDADQADDFHFMVMEYVDGVDLSQTVKVRGALPVAEACEYIQQAAIGLQHAHQRGMVHRDIKPHNLMVTKDGTVKILDFGLASLAPEAIADADTVEARGDLTAAGAIMGTPDFISPEQADDARTADIRSDIYSLGATLYFLLSAQPPFAKGSVMHKLKSHAQSDPEPLSTVRLDVPADLADVITRMMAKDPDERFQTPEELAEALKPFSQSAEPQEIVEPPTQVQPRRWKPTFLSLTAFAALFVATVFAGLNYFLQTNHGGVHIEVTPQEDRSMLGTHPLTIVDRSGKRPSGGTSGTRQDDATGVTRHFFNSANGRYDIHLVDEVLTVNGDEYTLENPNDEIRIVDDRVEITRVAEIPKHEDADAHKAGQQRSDNQLEMPLCWCPAGEFKMGRKQLPVTLTRGFWMGKHEVTQAQYEALMDDNPSENKGESLPVEKVAWNEAKKYCQKFTELERKAGRLPKGWEYRLPTEAQWEYACRAGTTLVWDDEKDLVYPSTFGDDLSKLGDYAWYSENSAGTPHPVGQKKPNAWGLCDMHGNVREWVRDAWQSKLSGGQDPEVDVSFPIHARRGGDWFSYAEPCGSPFIRGFGVARREVPHMMGFRLALVSVGESGAPNTSPNAKPVSECEAIQAALRNHFMDKHPLFAASVNQRTKIISDLRKLGDTETRRQIGELAMNSPVSEVINSFPGKPYVTFTEATRASGDEVIVVSVNLYRNTDGTCRFEVTQKERKKLAGETIANGKPITEEEVRKLVREIAKESDLTQLQGDWDAIELTQDGKKEFAADKAVGMLVQIKGDTITRIQTAPNGARQ